LIQWGDVATWVASVGTVAAVGVALWQVFRERSARQAREAQDRVQAARDRTDRHLAHARLVSAWTAPAEVVPGAQHVEYGDDVSADAAFNYRTPVYIHNSSAEPVYEVVAGLVFIQGAAPRNLEGMLDLRQKRLQAMSEAAASGEDVPTQLSGWSRGPVTTIGIVPPGTWRAWIRGKGWTSILSGRGGVDVAFVDRAGVSWIRRAMGPLEELPTRPLEYIAQHGLHGPYEFQPPEPTEGPTSRPPSATSTTSTGTTPSDSLKTLTGSKQPRQSTGRSGRDRSRIEAITGELGKAAPDT
jgi:hypothetical protein